MAHGLSVPLACLLALVLWTVSLVLALTVVRLRHLKGGGSVRDFGVPDDRRLVWRLFRAHANAVEKWIDNVSGGMKPKLQAALHALRSGVKTIAIGENGGTNLVAA